MEHDNNMSPDAVARAMEASFDAHLKKDGQFPPGVKQRLPDAIGKEIPGMLDGPKRHR